MAATIERVTIIGTGLIGGSVGLALRSAGYAGQIIGWDHSPVELSIALERGAITAIHDDPYEACIGSDVIVLAVPVLGILDWMHRAKDLIGPGTLLTDVGSTKAAIMETAERLYSFEPGQPAKAEFLGGHPMAGKESGGAALADGELFCGATWIFTPMASRAGLPSPLSDAWREWVQKFGCRAMDIDAARHDVICAWVSHLPQMLSTALSALLEDEFGDAEDMRAIGGRALREMTRLGASPYSMWRDVALSNTQPLADTLSALEQRLAHLRENLKTPELREEFIKANCFRAPRV
ncbi:MAG: prephenate dehydrogenase [Acidobacteriaceae bacterium]